MQTLTSHQPLGAATVLVSFEYTPGERATRNDPAEPAQVAITGAVINGHEVDAECFADSTIEKWEADILLEMEDGDDSDGPDYDNERESEAECAWESLA